MVKTKLFFYFLFLISLSQIFCEVEPEKISIDFSKSLKLTQDSSFNAYFVLEYTEQDLSNKNMVKISTKISNFENPAFIYASFSEKNPSADSRNFYSQSLGKNEIIISIL